MTEKVAEYVASFLEDRGIKDIFMLSGGFCLPLVDAVANSKINYICNLHEQAAAISAEAYAQYTNSPGVCLVTAGPGGTNTLTGVASAWLDSIPMIILSGQVQNKDIKGERRVRQIGFQEIDIVSIVKSVTKYAVTVTNPKDIKYVMELAWNEATTGRQGPVWVEIPLDVQSAQIDVENLRSLWVKPKKNRSAELKHKVSKLYELINSSKRPIIMVGNGVRSACAKNEFLELIDKLNIPVLTTWKSMDFMSENNPHFVGRPGIIAQRGANFSQQNCDLFISIGARLDAGQTAFNHKNFAKKAKKVIIDIDQAEIDKMEFDIECEINFDAKEVLVEALKQVEKKQKDFSEWLSVCKNWQKKYPVILKEYWERKECVNNYVIVDALSQSMMSGDLLIPGSSGACSEITMQSFKVKEGIRVFNSEGLGSMGFGIPASIGGCIASGKRRTICIDGDGGFIMNIQDLETVKRLDLPIKYFVLNNGGYASIRNSQNKHFPKEIASGEDSGVTLPDIEKVAHSFGIKYHQLTNHNNIVENVGFILADSGPSICEVIMPHKHECFPRNSAYKGKDGKFVSLPMEDLMPFLPRDEFEENMSISDD